MRSYETIDVRKIPSTLRHQQIISRILKLKVDEGIILVVDHDPKPLYYLLKEEHKMGFEWKYMKKGPQIWQVLLIRTSGIEDMLLEDIIGSDLSRLKYLARIDPGYCLNKDLTLRDAVEVAHSTADKVYNEITAKSDQSVNHFEYWDLPLFEQFILHNYHDYERHMMTSISATMGKVVEHHQHEIPEILETQRTFHKLGSALFRQMTVEADLFAGLKEKGTETTADTKSMFEPYSLIVDLLREINASTQGFVPPADACPLTQHLYEKLGELYDDVVCHIYLETTYLPLYLHDN